MATHLIRVLEASDEGPWRALWRAYLEFYQTGLPAEVTDTTWLRLLDPAESLVGLVAERAGALVGFAHCVLHRGTWSLTVHCYLEDLFVVPEVRGEGVGRAIIDAVYREADTRSADRVYWLTHESNSTARALYDRMARRSGFIHYTRN